MQDVLFFHLPDFNSRNLIETATTVIQAISNPFAVMQGNSFGGHVPACKCHKLSFHTSHAQCVIILDALGIHICKLHYFFLTPDFDSRNLIEAAATVIEAISNPFDVMQGNSFGGHMPTRKSHKLPYLPHTRCDYIGRPRHPYLQVLHQPEFDSRNLIEAATTVIEAISNPFDVMQGNSFGGHVPACKCHKLSNAITNQARQ